MNVLADLGDLQGAEFLEIHPGVIGQFLCDFDAKCLKGLVLGHEIGFAVDLHEHADFASGLQMLGDDALVGFAAGLLDRDVRVFLANDVHGGLKVAIGFGERLLAVHHAGVGHAAKFGDVGCFDISHNRVFS